MDPVNFQFADPNAAILNGIKTSAGLTAMQQQSTEWRQQQAAHQAAQQLALQQQADLRTLAMNPHAGHADYAAVMTKYPALSEHLGKAFKVMDEGQQKNLLQHGARAYSAILAGNNDLAASLWDDRAKAETNPAEAAHATMMANLIRQAPDKARMVSAMSMAGALGDKFPTAFSTLGTEARAEQKQPLEVAELTGKAQESLAKGGAAGLRQELENRNIVSQIGERSQRLGLDRDRLTTETQLKLQELGQKANTLDDGARKIINDSTIASVTADQSAGQMRDLAARLEQTDPSDGLFAKGSEAYKRLTGNQDAVTSLRQEYVRIRNSSALKMLPPGPASDKDIQIAMKGFPEDTANATTMASFLRGMAKLQQREGLLEGARAEWVNAVGHSGKPKTDITVDGVQIPAGSTFTDFARDYLPKAVEQREAQQVQTRSYMRWATPQSAPVAQPTGTPGTGLGRDRALGAN